MKPRQIVACGDNAFRKEPGKPHFFPYLVSLTGKAEPGICFIPTASGDAADYVASFYRCASAFTRKLSVLSLFYGDTPKIRELLLSQDVIYVGGGNTRNMLLLWKEWGVDRILREAYERGIILAGGSAGSVCWFEECCTDSVPGSLTPMKCLGWLEGSNCPHYDEEPMRRPRYEEMVKGGELKTGLAAQAGVGLHFVNESLHRVVGTRDGASAFRISAGKSGLLEEVLPAVNVSGS